MIFNRGFQYLISDSSLV